MTCSAVPCAGWLQGGPVALEDVEGLRDALLSSSSNMHAPLFLDEQVLQHTQALAYDSEVGASLLQMLSSRAWAAGGSGASVRVSLQQQWATAGGTLHICYLAQIPVQWVGCCVGGRGCLDHAMV
jgi:hypothetical protein